MRIQSFCPSVTLAGSNNNSDSLIIFMNIGLTCSPDTGEIKRTCPYFSVSRDTCMERADATTGLLSAHVQTI